MLHIFNKLFNISYIFDLYSSLDPEQKPELISIIDRLLADRTTLVVGSAVMAFTEVCPERSDLIHKVYRKLCALLVDIDEWGQVVIVNMLTRYARTQFTDPNINVSIRSTICNPLNTMYATYFTLSNPFTYNDS